MRTLVSGSSPGPGASRNTACVFAQVASIALSATTSAPQHDLARTLLEVLWRSPNRVHQIAARGGISNKFRNIPVTGVGDAVSRALGLSAAGADTYCAPRSTRHRLTERRRTHGARIAFWMDVDCGGKRLRRAPDIPQPLMPGRR